MNTDLMFSSETNEWSTPDYIYNILNKEFNFTLDPSSSNENHKCQKYFTVNENGLLQSWNNEIVFCNPPYGKEMKQWIKKSWEESLHPNTCVVMLLPSRTDTIYQHDYIFKYAKQIHFIKGRLKFGNSQNSAPFPSQIVVFYSDDKFKNKKILVDGKTLILNIGGKRAKWDVRIFMENIQSKIF